MQLPLVSVIMPCYNQGEFIEDAINSLLLQTYNNWECIIVNDGSSDNTDEIAKKWCSKDIRIKYFKNENKGVSNARNFAIKNSLADYILPLDADDKINKNYIEKCLEILLHNDNTKVVYGGVENFGTSSGELVLANFSFDYLIFSNMIPCSGLFRKKDWQRTQGYDEKMVEGYEDWEFWISLLKYGGNAIKVNTACLYYRSKPVSRMKGINMKNRYKLIAYIMHKHQELYSKLIFNYSEKLNINFSYCYYLGIKTYQKDDLLRLQKAKEQYNFRLNEILKKHNFFQRKKILYYWYKRGKLNLSFFSVLTH
ncbi:glycosyltransferase [Flavobacterium sp. ALJ2]|uniref:glycosyltransferase family 2 protein n=1 Tax=Flavobacterium sp. ALJ2 TaxID=2786960 RepID=UPI00189FD809|nr:glycosyltransferase [Flavobacterium sp. ALJ2]MBF7090625.1 glycosyltransferase [Flavobacterium sp. ALJ2]